jgi:hypothetical protein
MKKKSALRSIRAGDKARDAATQDEGRVRLGDWAPVFVSRIQAGDKATSDSATKDHRKVRLGDWAPVFGR